MFRCWGNWVLGALGVGKGACLPGMGALGDPLECLCGRVGRLPVGVHREYLYTTVALFYGIGGGQVISAKSKHRANS